MKFGGRIGGFKIIRYREDDRVTDCGRDASRPTDCPVPPFSIDHANAVMTRESFVLA